MVEVVTILYTRIAFRAGPGRMWHFYLVPALKGEIIGSAASDVSATSAAPNI